MATKRRSRVEGWSAGTLAGCSGIALLSGSVALADEKAADTGALALQEVIVMAEKRETSLQKTPIVVNVVSNEQLKAASVSEVQDIQRVVPNLFIRRVGARVDYAMRGVAAQIVTSSDQPSTAVLVDGIYTQAPAAGLGSLVDAAQVEILKGPQGTLFGRNATAGAISIKTQAPLFENSGQVDVDVGNFSKEYVTAMFNVAANDKLAVRAVYRTTSHDGYYDDGFDDERVRSTRLKVLYRATDNLSVLFSGNYADQRGVGGGFTYIRKTDGTTYTADPWAGPTDPANQALFPAFRGYYGYGAHFNNKSYGANGELNWDLGKALLTVLASKQTGIRDDVQQNFATTFTDFDEQSYEARLASNGRGRFTWLGGLYYYESDSLTNNFGAATGLRPTAVAPFSISARGRRIDMADFTRLVDTSNLNANTTAYAAFTQETYAIKDSVRLTVGGRWQHERAERYGTTSTTYINGVQSTFSQTIPVAGEWNVATWKVGLDVDVAADSMAYVSAATGWKAGKSNQFLPPYREQKPEKLLAYTLGIKNRFFDQRLQLNGELFYWDYRDRQIQFLANPVFDVNGVPQVTVTGAPGALVPGNAPKSHIQGADLDVVYRFTAADTVSLTAELLDEASFDDIGRQIIPACPAGRSCQANDAPKWSGLLSYRHIARLGAAGDLVFDASSKLQSASLLSLDATPGPASRQRSYTMSNVGLSYTPGSSAWSVRAYVNNVEDRLVKNSIVVPSAASAFYQVQYLAPRTYGLQLRATF